MGRTKRCRICKGLHDVRGDGICGGCYDNRMAGQLGLSYGKYISKYGHNLCRRDGRLDVVRICKVCGKPLSKDAPVRSVYCSKYCASFVNKRRMTCRGCRWYVTGSMRCTNPSSPFYLLTRGKICNCYERECDVTNTQDHDGWPADH